MFVTLKHLCELRTVREKLFGQYNTVYAQSFTITIIYKITQTQDIQGLMEQNAFKNVNCLNNSIYSYLETSDDGQSSNPYLNAVHFFNTKVKQKSVAA